MQMQKTMMYLPQYLKDRIKEVAESEGTSQAEVARAALEAGLGAVRLKKNTSAKSLLKLAELGRRYNTANQPKTSALDEIDKMWRGLGDNKHE